VESSRLAELLLEIGKDQHLRHSHQVAVHWLELSLEVIGNAGDEVSDNLGLRTTIEHSLVNALAHIGENSATEKAWDMVANLRTHGQETPALLLIQLHLYAQDKYSSPQGHAGALQRLFQSMQITDSTFQTAIHHTHILMTQDRALAHLALRKNLLPRCIEIEDAGKTERVLVLVVWNLVAQAEHCDTIKELRGILDDLHGTVSQSIGVNATHAIHTVCTIALDICGY
jgi:hypothetical protein